MDESSLSEIERTPSDVLANIFTTGKVPGFTFVTKNLCVGWIDIVNSTRITSMLSKSKVSPFFCLFLSQMSSIVRESGGIVVKNAGDSLLFYFPETSNTSNESALLNSVECGIKLVEHRRILNSLMLQIGLPIVDYRVSLDYGEVTISKPEGSQNDDIFGATVSYCAKMNKFTKPNSVVIGGDFYQIVKSFEGFRFSILSEFNNGLKQKYSLYNVQCI